MASQLTLSRDNGEGAPTLQKGRRRRRCECAGACFYCDEPLERHEHDHFPIPWRHGGREVVPACHSCHSLKDRRLWHQWTPGTVDAAQAGASRRAQRLMGLLYGAIVDQGEPYAIGRSREQARDLMLASVRDECSTPEARIALAQMFNVVLDIYGSSALDGSAFDNEEATQGLAR